MWYIPIIQKLAPVLGAKLFEAVLKKLEERKFAISPNEEKMEHEQHWLSTLPKLYLKKGVLINGGHFYPEMIAIINAARENAPDTTDGAIWITSAADSSKGRVPNSLHYKNRAFDFRISNLKNPETAKTWTDNISKVLGVDYDVILESNHIHVEYQPKEEPTT